VQLTGGKKISLGIGKERQSLLGLERSGCATFTKKGWDYGEKVKTAPFAAEEAYSGVAKTACRRTETKGFSN